MAPINEKAHFLIDGLFPVAAPHSGRTLELADGRGGGESAGIL